MFFLKKQDALMRRTVVKCSASVLRERSAFSARRFGTQNSLPSEDESGHLEQFGLEDITSLITSKCRLLATSKTGNAKRHQDECEDDWDPVKIFQSCWGWRSSDDCRFEDSPSATSPSLSSISSVTRSSVPVRDPSAPSRRKRMAESALLRDMAASIIQKGWNAGTKQEFATKFPNLTPFHICDILKAVQDPKICMQIFDWARGQTGFRHTTRSYNSLLGVLAGREGMMILAHLQEQMEEDGCEADKVTLCTLIKAYSKLLRPIIVLELYEKLRQKDWVPGIVTYSCIIDTLAKHGYTEKAREVYFEMRMSGCYLDKTGYNIIINLFGRKKNLHMVTRLYNDMCECGLEPDGYTYAALIQAHLRIPDSVLEAYKLFEEAISKKLTLTLATCNALLYALGKAEEINLTLQLYHQMKNIGLHADTITYNTIVTVLGQGNRISDLYSVIEDMTIKDNRGGVAHVSAIEWLVSAGKIGVACTLVEDMSKREGHPATFAVDALLQGLIRLGAFDKVHEFVRNMAAHGFRLEASKVSEIVKSFAESGNVDGTLKIFYLKRELGYPPDQDSYDSAIICLSKYGSLIQALRFFDDMSEIGLTPRTDTCNHLIHMFCMKCDMATATEIFNRMTSIGCVHNVGTYNQLIAGYANASDWVMAFNLAKDMETEGLVPDTDTYLPLIFSLGNEGRMEHALQLSTQMLDEGLKPSSHLCMKLLNMLSRKGHERGALNIFTKLKEKG
ncbi:hypothetical protein KP509_21G065100 [Ceratopteris richardii]|nr:hypothetical protein KP509_21G065100 [Ceratopteris richardii]